MSMERRIEPRIFDAPSDEPFGGSPPDSTPDGEKPGESPGTERPKSQPEKPRSEEVAPPQPEPTPGNRLSFRTNPPKPSGESEQPTTPSPEPSPSRQPSGENPEKDMITLLIESAQEDVSILGAHADQISDAFRQGRYEDAFLRSVVFIPRALLLVVGGSGRITGLMMSQIGRLFERQAGAAIDPTVQVQTYADLRRKYRIPIPDDVKEALRHIKPLQRATMEGAGMWGLYWEAIGLTLQKLGTFIRNFGAGESKK